MNRHAKDAVGASLYVGDAVMATRQRGGKGSRWHLVRAVVLRLTPQGARVQFDEDGVEYVARESQVMKVRQP